MKKRLVSRSILIAVLFGSLLVTAGIVFVADTVPSLPSAPLAPVAGMPDQGHELLPYDGLHPRLQPRPVDTFDFPIRPGDIGPVLPLFDGPLQYPFFCGRDRARAPDVQPLVDNNDGVGVPVFASTAQVT